MSDPRFVCHRVLFRGWQIRQCLLYLFNFFRALLPATAIKSIETPLKAVTPKKKNVGFQKAIDELSRHQALLEKQPVSYYIFSFKRNV